ncbi:SDR family oxidoreductase [Candidatus Thorarchaeota archaeon]|nr:MAG: SDR family oxidoreductase [Candidatus Thorarchaeota archaeon]
MEGRVTIVTGSNSGIGRETALGLAQMGATVVMAVRNREAGEKARREIIEESGNENIEILVADLSSMTEVKQLASEFKQNHDKLHVLVNNAGAIISKRTVTVDGFELTFALNHLAPVLLIHELLDVLAEGAPSRVVNVSSGAHAFGKIDFENLQNEKYSSMRAYGSAKLMNIMATYTLSKKLEGSGITVNVLHPGFVRTNFGKKDAGFGQRAVLRLAGIFAKTPAEGAETSIYLASSPEVDGVSGKYFADSKMKKSSKISYNEEIQEKLWAETLDLLGLEDSDFYVPKQAPNFVRQDLS